MKTKQNKIILIALAIAIVIIVAALWYFSAPQTGSGTNPSAAGAGSSVPTSTTAAAPLDDFAKCLTQKGLAMYGLYSCPHCQAEKALFGSSFQYVKYVECSADPNECTAKNVDAVPTWIESNGQRLVGTQSLQALSQASGCELPH